ncbi:MAG: T9SS type A sorting domain-containing protein [Ignavibacteriaceae bacterium]
MHKFIISITFLFAQQLFTQNFTIIGIPDTQFLVDVDEATPEIFDAQTQWIVAQKNTLNIVYVAHLGDVVQHGSGEDQEWQDANHSMSFLEVPDPPTYPEGIPYGVAVGNHDQSGWGDPDGNSTAKFNEYFGISRFSGRSYYGGYYGSNNDNHYDLFSANGIEFIAIYIEYDSDMQIDAGEISWAKSILEAYSNRRAIIVSHRILDEGNPGDWHSEQGENLYNAFKVHPNVFLMLCGHKKGEGRRTDTYNGNTIHTLLADYQGSHDGWLRIMEFNPALGTIDVKTYSPWFDEYDTGSSSQFTLNSDFTPLPVELAFFTGSLNGNNIELRWRTETEVNNYGFFIERATENLDWLTLGFVEGNGNSNSANYYSFSDSDIYESGNYNYRLRQTDNDGTFEYSDVLTVTVDVPVLYSLSQNYPNPFNPETRIDYSIPEQQNVTFRVYNMLGEMVKELVNEVKPAGTYTVTFDGSDLPSGVYVYRIQAEGFSENKKMTFLK